MDHGLLRQQIIAAGKEIYQQRLVAGTWGNVSVRIQRENHILITPSGMGYNSLQPEDLVLLDDQGQVMDGIRKPSSEWHLHAEFYRRRPDIQAIIHVHSPWAAAYAVAHQPIPMLLEESAQVIGHSIPVAVYAHPGTEQLAAQAAAALGQDHRAILLANHGLVGTGASLEEAMLVCVIAEKTAMIGILARSLGNLNPLADNDVSYLNRAFKDYGQPRENK